MTHSPVVLGLALMAASCTAGPVGAQSGGMDHLSAYDMIDACLYRQASPSQQQACIGEFQQACETRSAAGGTMAGMMVCASEENDAWGRWLDSANQELRNSLPEDAVGPLEEAQRRWVAHREQDCDFLASLVDGDAQAGFARMRCLRNQTAERVIRLQDWRRTRTGG